MTAVRSNLLFGGALLDASAHSIYTTPSGYRTLVKSVVVRNQATAAQVVTLSVLTGATLVGILGFNLSARGSAGDTSNLAPWIVLPPGYSLTAQSANASGAYWLVSGAELQLP
jgi:hypothetical protein